MLGRKLIFCTNSGTLSGNQHHAIHAQTPPALQVNLLSYLLVQLPETIVKQAAGQAAKAQVGTESCRAGQQWIGIHPWSFVICNPCLDRFRRNEPKPPCICGTLLKASLYASGEDTHIWQHSLFYLLPTTAGRGPNPMPHSRNVKPLLQDLNQNYFAQED